MAVHNEAPASVTYDLQSKDGYGLLFTLRAESDTELFELMGEAESTFQAKGYEPKVRKSWGGGGSSAEKAPIKYREAPCPKCSARVAIKEITLSDGTKKTLEECENRKYDFRTKQNTGTCDYQLWLDPTEANHAPTDPTPAQQKVLESRGLWAEGITRAEANDLLSGLK